MHQYTRNYIWANGREAVCMRMRLIPIRKSQEKYPAIGSLILFILLLLKKSYAVVILQHELLEQQYLDK